MNYPTHLISLIIANIVQVSLKIYFLSEFVVLVHMSSVIAKKMRFRDVIQAESHSSCLILGSIVGLEKFKTDSLLRGIPHGRSNTSMHILQSLTCACGYPFYSGN